MAHLSLLLELFDVALDLPNVLLDVRDEEMITPTGIRLRIRAES